MSNTYGYISGALSGLALLSCLAYSIENTKAARDSLHDTRNSLIRTLEKQKGYLSERNLLEVLTDANHDIVQRKNPLTSLERVDIGIGNTPYQDQKLDASQWKNTKDFGNYLDQELNEHWLLSDYAPSGLKDKEELIVGLAGAGLGLMSAAALARKK